MRRPYIPISMQPGTISYPVSIIDMYLIKKKIFFCKD